MNIIFVCTGNTCRSPMAEAVAKSIFAYKGIEADVISRGLSVALPSDASENSRKAMEEMGLSLEGFTSRPLTYEDVEWADVIITMTKAHKTAVAGVCLEMGKELYTMAEAAGEKDDVSDPFGGNIEIYRNCAKQIKAYIEKIAEKLV